MPFEHLNLDDESEVNAFLSQYTNQRGRGLARQLGLVGPGASRVADNLSAYARNKRTAMTCRQCGDIANALAYESICDRIYHQLPEGIRW